jgi:hypothetical protein
VEKNSLVGGFAQQPLWLQSCETLFAKELLLMIVPDSQLQGNID